MELSAFILYAFVALFGILLGSFSSVLISRWREGKGGILMGRSECPHCHNTLTPRELIPIVSYLIQGGKCFHCRTPIPLFYPALELFMGALFVMIVYVMLSILAVDPLSLAGLIFFLYTFITGIYIVYDLRYMEIPDQALIPGITLALIALLILIIDPRLVVGLFPLIRMEELDLTGMILSSLLGAWGLYTFFYLQILIPGIIYAYKQRKSRLIWNLFGEYITFPLSLISWGKWSPKYTYDPEDENMPSWVGGGDLRIALFIGLTLGAVHAASSLIFAYMLGGIFGMIYLLIVRKRGLQIPFGPFLGAGWVLSLIFYIPIYEFFLRLSDIL